MQQLPEGYSLRQDGDGDWWLTPPPTITIFSEPGEGVLIGTCDETTALADALQYLSEVE